ncbi:hypothetical protein KIPE111705_36875 [Kibdelosporangium persicum]
MLGKAEWADRGTWITTPAGTREQVVEKPLTERGWTYLQTTDGQYRVSSAVLIEFFSSEDGPV